MKLKSDVKVTGLRPELLLAVMVANGVYRQNGHEMTITSLLDGRHSKTSLHYTGCAVDLRIRDLAPSTIEVISDEIRHRLTSDYDVLREPDHIHIEFQPRRAS